MLIRIGKCTVRCYEYCVYDSMGRFVYEWAFDDIKKAMEYIMKSHEDDVLLRKVLPREYVLQYHDAVKDGPRTHSTEEYMVGDDGDIRVFDWDMECEGDIVQE